MTVCIYCGTGTPDTAFTREHVLQEGFGRFQHALVLHNTVCEACNHYFSRTLDLALTRESAEGLERYRWGVKDPSEIGKFKYGVVTLRADDSSEFSGASVQLIPSDRGLIAQLVDGGAVRDAEGEGFTHFTTEEMLSGRWQERAVDWHRGLKLFGADDVVARMQAALKAQGVEITNFRRLVPPPGDDPSVTVAHQFEVTDVMKRGLAKIAFNYLAFVKGAAFAQLPAFDPIRKYVRYGEKPALEPIHSTFDLPFRMNAPENVRPVIHWLSLSAHEEHRNLLGTVMLFGFMEHIVILAEDFPGPWFELPIAHVFNLKTKRVKEMTPAKPRWQHADRDTSSAGDA
jgi:hypothetical protein